MPTRVLTPGLLAGIRPVPQARELTTFDLGLYGGADVRPVTGFRDPSYGVDIPLPPAPKLLPAAIQQNPMHQVLPLQGRSRRKSHWETTASNRHGRHVP